jgi:gliding motility-associated-like protein
MKAILHVRSIITVAVFLRILFSGLVYGSHTMGADLTYQHLGGNTYRITISFYRDCIGIAAPATPTVNINSPSCGQSLSVVCTPRPGTGQEVTPTCSSAVTTCAGGAFTGIQEWVYDGIVTLPAQCSDWIFGYSLCCRNAAITNIINPSSSTFYIYATLNNLTAPQNSSPTFSNKPVPFLCVGQKFCFNHGAFDADGDSLVYSLITPKQTVSTNVNYMAPYNASNPLNSIPGTSFNPLTGDICLTPQSLEVTVMAVLVREYRNGILIGSVERDLQLTVMNCNNNLPSLTGINGTNDFSITVCANEETCFDIFSNDPDTGQQLIVDWNYAIPTATFNSSVAQHPVGTFCWTPNASNINHTYYFTASVTDDACPYNGSQTYAYTINVTGIFVNAGPDQNIACNDQATITAIASAGSGAYTYLWSNGSTMQSITVGEGTYWVTASDGNCTATDTVVINMPFSPVAAFAFSPPGCLNQPISFTDQSTTPGGTIISWNWSFGDGDTSNIQNPVHQFAGTGTYTVELIVGTTLGCYDTISIPVVLGVPPTAGFMWGQTCVNTNTTFTDQSTGNPVSWNWTFGDGFSSSSQNPNHVYNTPGNYTVTLISNNSSGCPDTVSHTINVYSSPTVNLPTIFLCSGSTKTLDAGNPGSSYSWSTGATTQSIQIDTGGSYSVIVTDVNGCTSSDSVYVSYGPSISVNLGNVSFCQGQTATLDAGYPGLNYQWMPGGQNTRTITINSSGTYSVSVTDTSGCSGSDTILAQVNPLPITNFSMSPVCFGQAMSFTDQSTVASGAITSWQWNFGDGNTSSTQNPNHTFGSVGNYIVSLTTITAQGCSSYTTKAVVINPIPVADFSHNASCRNVEVAFSNTSTVTSGSITGFNWNFGDGTSASIMSPVHNYSAAGSYIVSLIAVSNNGCSDTATRTITITNLPSVAFSAPNTCAESNVGFVNNTVSTGSPVTTYQWNFGNGTTSSVAVPSFQYSTPGTYPVQLIATAANGCKDTASSSITIFSKPVADFAATPACLDQPITFQNNSSISNGSLVNYLWSFGDNTSSTQVNPVHSYPADGSYSINLIVVSNNGCRDTINRTVDVYPIPQLSFSGAEVCKGDDISFQNTSTISTGSIASWLWSFDDGSYSFTQNPTHTYPSEGTFNVTLAAMSNMGCASQTNAIITVHPNPVAAFASSDVCEGSSTQLLNQSTITNGSLLSSYWTLSDGSIYTEENPLHNFAGAGNFSITLLVVSPDGCSGTITQNLDVHHLPVARFAAPNACAGSSINFTNQSTSQDGNITAYLWAFGDGNFSFDENPVHTYQDSGNYIVDLVTISSYGCSGNYIDSISAFALPQLGIQLSNACAGTPVQVSGTLNHSGASSYSWMVSDGYTSGNSSFTHTFNSPGTYNITLSASNSNGCSGTQTEMIDIYPNPVVSFSTNDVCESSQNFFSNQTSIAGGSLTGYSWNFGDNQYSTQFNPAHRYATAGTYNATLSVVSDRGCSANLMRLVTVHPIPVADFSAGAQGCSPVPAVFANNSLIISGDIAGYLWNFGDGGISTDTFPTHIYEQSGTFDVTLTVVSSFGCQSSVSKPNIITVHPMPTAEFTADPMVTDLDMPVVNFYNQSMGYQTYRWIFGDGTTTTTELNPTHTFRDTGTYTTMLITVNNYGCTDTVMSTIEVRLKSTLFVANCFTPNGDGNNDLFRPYYTNMEDIQVWVFDRWGKLLTNWKGLEGVWDGYYQGQKCQSDTYVYKIIGKGLDGKYSEWVGHVSIVY